MNLTEIRVIIRDNVNNATAEVDQEVEDAVNFLSNFFHARKIDTSQTTVTGQNWITLAADFLKLKQLRIDGEYIKELLNDELYEAVDDEERQRWHISDERVNLITDMSTTGKPIAYLYEASFVQPELAVDTDVPDKLIELVYRGATYRYFDKLATKIATERENYPDVTPKEIEAMRKQWKESFDSLLKELT